MLMKTNSMSPVFNFRKWLQEQPIARQREIQAAERQYLSARRAIGSGVHGGDPAEGAFLELMGGYQDTPAGTPEIEQVLDIRPEL